MEEKQARSVEQTENPVAKNVTLAEGEEVHRLGGITAAWGELAFPSTMNGVATGVVVPCLKRLTPKYALLRYLHTTAVERA